MRGPSILIFVVVVLATGAASALTLEEAPFVIHFTEGGEELASRSLEILEKGLVSYSRRLPPGEEPIQLHICRTFAEFQRLAGSLGSLRVEGFARSRQGLMVVKAPHLLSPTGNYAAILRHELLHVLLERNSGPDNLPRWFNEGLAMVLSREARWSNLFRVARMYTGGRIIPYGELPYVFQAPGNEVEFGDAYAQSLSMTKYLRERVGEETFWAIVGDLRTMSFGDSLRARTPLTPVGLYDEWRGALWKVAVLSYTVPGSFAFQLMALLAVLAYLRKRHQGRRLLKQWAEEEELEEEDENENGVILPWELEDNEPPLP